MFVFTLKKEIVVRIMLIAVILFNALASNAQPVQAKQEAGSTIGSRLNGMEQKSFSKQTFDRPKARVAQQNGGQTYAPAPALISTYAQNEQLQIYTATGEEGLRLAQDWIGAGQLAANWIVQKSASNTANHETLDIFFSSSLPKPSSILRPYVGQFHYTVKPDEAGPNKWVSFQLVGVATSYSSEPAAGGDRARFFVDIASPDGLHITCSEQTHGAGRADSTSFCVQDDNSHIHGMADGGATHYLDLQGPFNNGGQYATVAVKGLTAGQVLVVTFYTPVNNLNTYSGSSLDGCISSAPSTNGFTAMPINTRTGNYEYFTEDISIPTSAGNLSFTRDYVSATTSNVTSLSPGWTHNLDARLIFPGQPESLAGKVVFKAHTANRYLFNIDSVNNTYAPEPGLHATLVKNPGSPITYTLSCTGQNTYTFSDTGKLLTYANAQGHTWTYTYYPNGKLDRGTAEGGKYLDLGYDAQGRIVSVRDHTNRSISYHYNANGDLDTFTDVLGQTWTYEYNNPALNHYLTRAATPGNVTIEQQEYYPNGKAWKQYDGEGNLVVELIYNTDGTTTIKDAVDDANPETHAYDDRGTLRIEENGAGGQQEKHYDFNFRPDLITDPLGNPTMMEWSDNGTSLEYIKDALDGETSIYYEDPENPNGPTRIVDPMQYETKYFYNDLNFPTLPTRIEYPLSFDNGVTWIGTDYEYYPPSSAASAGRVKFVTDALGNQMFYTYTSSGQAETVTTAYGTPNALTTTYDYDSLGRMVSVTDERGIVTHNDYDDAGRLTKTIRSVHPTNTTQNYQDKYNIVTGYFYDLRGNQIAMKDTYGIITRTYYDLANRPVTVVQNLTGQTIENGTPPSRNTGTTDENIRTDTEYDDAGNVIATTDPLGIVTRSYYDSANRPSLTIQNFAGTGAYNPAYPDQNIRIEYFYDANGNVIATKDTLGIITRTYYDALNRPSTIIQNLTGQDISVETPPDRGNSSNIRTDTYYDANGNVIVTVDPKGVITRTYYDALNRPITVVQNLARTVAEAISNPNPPAAGTSESDIRTDTYYDEAGNVIATVEPRGVVTRTYYDSANRPVTVVNNLVGWDIYLDTPPARGDGLSDENVRTDIAYDQYGRRDFTTDSFGRVTKYEYDEAGQLVKVTANFTNGGSPQNDDNQRNIVAQYEYDALGRQVKTIDTLGRVSLSAHDDLGRVTTFTQNYLQGQPQNYENAGNRFNIVTTYTYDVRGSQIGVTDTANVKTRTYYDAVGRSVTVVRNLGGDIADPTPPVRGTPPNPEANLRTDTIYLGNGNVDYLVDELGKTTDYGYDSLGRMTTVLDPLLHASSFEYNAVGNRTLMTDAEGVSTRYEYDGLNRLKAVVENYRLGFAPDHETNVRTEYTYDAGGNRLSILDGNNHSTFFTYSPFGQVETETDALGNDYVYTYDSMGNRRTMTDANDALTVFEYDELNRLVSINYPNPTADVSFEYDALGHRLSMTDGLGTTSWSYNNLDLPNSITDPFATQVSYEYDEVGNRTLLSYGNQLYAYQYNDVNQLEEVISDQLSVAGYQYDAAGRLKTVTRPNGVSTAYNYYDNGWLQDIFHTSGTETLASYQYQYDNVGNRVQAIENVTLPSATNESPQFDLGSGAALNEGGQFTRSVSFTDPDSTEWQLTIDYGDGTTPTQTTLYAQGTIDLAHVYVEDSTYTLTVTLNDNEGGETSDSMLVTVANVPPMVNAGEDQTVNVNETVSVNATYSDAGIQDTHTATINWGYGNSGPATVTPTGSGSGTVSAQHVYTSTGNFTAEVCVTDSDNGTGCDSINVNVGGGFPSTGVLDNFNRTNGAIGSNWSGNKSGYSISSNQLLVGTSGSNSDIYWNASSFDADQEAYITFTQLNTNAVEQDLLLKSQSNSTWGDGVLEVLYDANNDIVQVWTYKWPQGWVQHGADISPVSFAVGDRFGARALADGTVEVYKNEDLLGTRDITSWIHYDDGGYIGLWFIGAQNARFDDFGGGTVPGGESIMSMEESREVENVTPEQLKAEVSNVSTFWQGIPADLDQEAIVTFTGFSKETGKPQSNGVWGVGAIQVMYDVPNQRIQLWKYDPDKGWEQIGKDIPVTFAEGDVFSVQTGKKGTIEVYQNGKLLTQQKVSSESQLANSVVSNSALSPNTATFQPVSYRPTADSVAVPPYLPLPKSVLRSPDVLAGSDVEGLPLQQTMAVTITYGYDPLYRLTESNYSNGDYYHYGYDAVGNRLTQETFISGLPTTTSYLYDDANRLTTVNGVTYIWDNNGNLLSDGVNTYTYDFANHLKTFTNATTSASYAYNGLSDRLRETVNGVTTTFTMDLNIGLTQALSDGANTYIYGVGRIAQINTGTEYFLGDALGSVRQLTDASGTITYARAYDPYGVVTQTLGSSQTSYAFTGEAYGDSTQLTYLRSRYYASGTGRFLTRDTWMGDYSSPISYNKWIYAYQNPINLLDPTGMKPGDSNYCLYLSGRDWLYCNNIVRGINPEQPMTVGEYIVFDQLDSCFMYKPPLQDVFPHVVYTQPTGTWKEYGWWWHYLLDRTPGTWNNHGKGHIKFSDVIAFALAAELSTSIDVYPKLVGYAAGAFYTKGSGEGYYRMIGSRQSVYMRVNTALYGSPLGGTYDFNNNVKYFNEINDIANNASRLSARGEDILKGTNLKPEEKLAYEWGNPTLSSPQKLLNVLKSFDNKGPLPGQVLWFSDEWYSRFPTTNVNGTIVYKLAFVVTKEQINELCGNASCIAP